MPDRPSPAPIATHAPTPMTTFAPLDEFHSPHYLRHNQRRLEHLASLRLPLAGRTVLEVGAGIGDHTPFYLDRGCTVRVSDAREENLAVLRQRFAGDARVAVERLDLDHPPAPAARSQIGHCYGILYHLHDPAGALAYLAASISDLLVVETCVSFGSGRLVNQVPEPAQQPSQSVHGVGARPTRDWVYSTLGAHFPYVYVPATQPWHEEFPLDWDAPASHGSAFARAVFVASRTRLDQELLLEFLPPRQRRG